MGRIVRAGFDAYPARTPMNTDALARTISASALAPLVAALASCGSLSLSEFDVTARTAEARTVVYEPEFSLYSPFDVFETRDWLKLVDVELPAVARALELDLVEQRRRAGPVIVYLKPIPGMRPKIVQEGDTITLNPIGSHPLHGVEGMALDQVARVFVEPAVVSKNGEGNPVRAVWGASGYRTTLRHELAHVLAHAAGIEGDAWFNEGVATLLEYAQVEGSVLAIDPASLRVGRQCARSANSLSEVLLETEDVEGIFSGRVAARGEWRPQLLAFFTFLLERETARGGTLRSTIDGAQRTSRARLLELEPEFRAWLAPGTLDESASAPTSLRLDLGVSVDPDASGTARESERATGLQRWRQRDNARRNATRSLASASVRSSGVTCASFSIIEFPPRR